MQLPIPAAKPIDVTPPEIAPPQVPIQTAPKTPDAVTAAPELPPPPKPRPARTRPSRPPVQAAKPEPVGPPAPVVQPPQLESALTESDRKALIRTIDQLVARTERNLNEAAGRSTNVAQQDLMSQSRSLIEQVKEVRARDLTAARSLAERAEVLSREVLARFR